MVNVNDEYARKVAVTADLDAMARWARRIFAAREPDVTLVLDGRPYLRRWWVVPRNDVMNVYLHEFVGSDEPRALHDHRGDNVSWLLDGSYLEHTVDGIFTRNAGVARRATDLHRVELIGGRPVISLFFIGPIVRDWGFQCGERRGRWWVPWKVFNERGCE
jgi:hypothetical protein